MKKCPICKILKTTRIKNQAEVIVLDIPIKLNDKIALDVFGPLPETRKENEYMRSVRKVSGLHLYLRAGVILHYRVGGILQSNPHLIE